MKRSCQLHCKYTHFLPFTPKFSVAKNKARVRGASLPPHTLAVFLGYWRVDYPPKLSKWMLSGSTPRLKSMFSTALLMGPGPHM